MASVVIIRPAIDAASCSATRTTFAGSTMPALRHVDILLGLGVEAVGLGLFSVILPTTIEPSTPAFSAIWRIGLKRPEHDVDAGLDVGILVAELTDCGLGP